MLYVLILSSKSKNVRLTFAKVNNSIKFSIYCVSLISFQSGECESIQVCNHLTTMLHFLILASYKICACCDQHSLIVEYLDSYMLLGQHNLFNENKAFDFSNDNCHGIIYGYDRTFPGNAQNSSFLAEFHNSNGIICFFAICIISLIGL